RADDRPAPERRAVRRARPGPRAAGRHRRAGGRRGARRDGRGRPAVTGAPLTSWVPGADGSGFPAEHLPYGVVFPASGGGPRPAVRIGEHILDLARLVAGDVAGLAGPGRGLLDGRTLDPFLAAGPDRWRAVRARLTEIVS